MVYRFLLVSLCINAILGEVTVSERKRKLEEMTKGNHLGDAYATTLDRVKAQKGSRSRLGMDALMWVSNSERPLHTSELCHALGVKIGAADLDIEKVPTIRTLLGCSLGLIAVEASSSTVRILHSTLQEYLSNNPSLFASPHSMIAEVCLAYLNFRCIRELLRALSSAPPSLPLVEYASCYWGERVGRQKAEGVTSLALVLLIGFEQHISSRALLLHCDRNRCWPEPCFDRSSSHNGFTGLHGAAFFGLGEIVAALLAMKEWNINATDAIGRTALTWAAARGHEDVMRVLLRQRDVNVNARDIESGKTPLLLAALAGHEGVVKLLLERGDINPNTAETKYGRTPLWWAAGRGHERVVKLLLEREDINPNTPDTAYCRTPLIRAAAGGHEGVVKLLLEREDVNPNRVDPFYGQSPLLWAVGGHYEGVVKLLLEREDINPDIPDLNGETALALAASLRYAGIVKLLSEPRFPFPTAIDTEKSPGCSSPEQSTCLSPSKPLPPAARPLFPISIPFLVIISSIFLFYIFSLIGPSLSAFLSQLFYS